MLQFTLYISGFIIGINNVNKLKHGRGQENQIAETRLEHVLREEGVLQRVGRADPLVRLLHQATLNKVFGVNEKALKNVIAVDYKNDDNDLLATLVAKKITRIWLSVCHFT